MFKNVTRLAGTRRGRSERESSNGVAGMIPPAQLISTTRSVAGLSFTARIERAQSHRARSGSTGIVTVAPFSFFNILLMH